MAREYSLYEAKARLSALIRQVREGRSIVITVHGTPVAELRPIQPEGAQNLAERIAELKDRGELASAAQTSSKFTPGKPKQGALRRFLATRD